MSASAVSVILIAYYGDDWLRPCLESLHAASRAQLHLILVDNAGNHRLQELDLERFDVEVLSTKRPLGFAEANNFALVHASRLEEYVLFLNQDTISPPGWIDAALAAFADRDIGAVSPLIRNYDDTGWDPSFLACLSKEDRQRLEEACVTVGIEVARAPAPALIVRRDVLRQTGPFDPIFGSYYEDYDLCLRIRRAGYGILFSCASRVQHYSGSSTQSSEARFRRMRQIIRNRFIYEVRLAGDSRGGHAMRMLVSDLPRRLARGVLRTNSSQPVRVTLGAYADLFSIVCRLISAKRDDQEWQNYLRRIGWKRACFSGLEQAA